TFVAVVSDRECVRAEESHGASRLEAATTDRDLGPSLGRPLGGVDARDDRSWLETGRGLPEGALGVWGRGHPVRRAPGLLRQRHLEAIDVDTLGQKLFRVDTDRAAHEEIRTKDRDGGTAADRCYARLDALDRRRGIVREAANA